MPSITAPTTGSSTPTSSSCTRNWREAIVRKSLMRTGRGMIIDPASSGWPLTWEPMCESCIWAYLCRTFFSIRGTTTCGLLIALSCMLLLSWPGSKKHNTFHYFSTTTTGLEPIGRNVIGFPWNMMSGKQEFRSPLNPWKPSRSKLHPWTHTKWKKKLCKHTNKKSKNIKHVQWENHDVLSIKYFYIDISRFWNCEWS